LPRMVIRSPVLNVGQDLTSGTPGAHPGEWFALEAVRWQKGDLARKRE
jgi:hypothetical protein